MTEKQFMVPIVDYTQPEEQSIEKNPVKEFYPKLTSADFEESRPFVYAAYGCLITIMGLFLLGLGVIH